jgi:hypothetical protein
MDEPNEQSCCENWFEINISKNLLKAKLNELKIGFNFFWFGKCQ